MSLPAIGLLPGLLFVSNAPPPVESSGTEVVWERIYFGRNIGDSLGVTDVACPAFLTDVVTTRFPDGLTSWHSRGQWRNARGVIEKEQVFVLEIENPAGTKTDPAITEIVKAYERQFHQEAISRLWGNARAILDVNSSMPSNT